MHWNSIKTLKLSPAPKPIFERSLLLHQDIFLQGYTSFVALWKKGKSPTVLKQHKISYRLLLILLPLWVKVSHRHYQYFNTIHHIVFLEIYGALLIKKEIFCRFCDLIIIEDVFNMVPSVRGSHVYKSPLDDTTYEAFPVSCTPGLALTAMRSLTPASPSFTTASLSLRRVPLYWSLVWRALGR
jgi:hypothetical protein